MIKPEHRELGTITDARIDDDNEDRPSSWLQMRFIGSGQGFGGYNLGPYKDEWIKELCKVFGVTKFEDIVGKKAYALRSFDYLNASIVGIEEYETGNRFVAADFFRRHGVKPEENQLEDARKRAKVAIASHTRRINQEVEDLMQLDKRYCEWDPFYILKEHDQ